MLRAVFLFVLCCSLLQAGNLEQQMLAIQDRIEAGDLEEANRQLTAALALYPHAGSLYNLRGIIHAERHQIAEARADFAKAAKLAPSLVPAWDNLAHSCQSALTADPACSASTWRLLAPSFATQLALRPDFTEADFEAISNALTTSDSSETIIALVTGLDSRSLAGAISLQSLAIAYEQRNRIAEARQTLERVATLDPKNTAHLIELARLADLCHDEEGALGYLAHARDLDPRNGQIHYLFAMIASKMELPVEARASLDKALAIDPQNPDYNYAMGFVLLSTRDAATASTYFQKFVAARPENVKGHYALGISYYASGDYEKAKQQMDLVKDSPATAGGAEYFLGRIARQEDNRAGAKAHLERSIRLLPNFAESHTELARVLISENDRSSAEAELRRALAIDPNSFQANAQLLALYRRTRDPRAAAQEQVVKKLDEQRSKRAELMLRTIEARP